MKRKVLILSLAFLLSFFISGASIPSVIAAESKIIFVEGSDIDTLDPQITRSRPSEIPIDHIYNKLVKWKDTELSEIVPDLAESWETSKDGLIWTFKLRKGIRFTDGSPFNAHAVKFSLERILDKKTASPNRSLFIPITEIETPDDYTIRLKTKTPFASLLENLAAAAGGMLSPSAVNRWGDDFGRNPVGTGPFILEKWIPGEMAVLVKNKNYFGKPANIDKIIYKPVPEGSARAIELESGQADIVNRIPPEAVARLKANPNLNIRIIPSTFQVFWELNSRKAPFNDIRVRKAVNYAVDKEAIVDKILGGYGSVPDGLFPPGVQARMKLLPYGYDPERAKSLLAEAGYPKGFKTKLWTTHGRYMKDKEVAEAIQGYLARIGIETEFKIWEWSAYQKTIYSPAIEDGGMWILGTSIPTADWRLTRKFTTGDPSNLTGYSNPKVDELLMKARATMDYTKRMDLYKEIQRIVWDEAPWLFVYNQVQIIGMKKEIEGLEVFGYEVLDFMNVKKK